MVAVDEGRGAAGADVVVVVGNTSVRPGWMTLVIANEFTCSNDERLTLWRHARPARLSPERTVIVAPAAVRPALPDDADQPDETDAVDGAAPVGSTRVSPGWMTLVIANEFARSSADRATLWRQAIPARLSPARTVIVVESAEDGAASAPPTAIGAVSASVTPVARKSRFIRVTSSPSVARSPALTKT